MHSATLPAKNTERRTMGAKVNLNPAGFGFWSLVAEDFRTHNQAWFNQGFWALFWHRFGNWQFAIKSRPLRLPFTAVYIVMLKVCEMLCGIRLPFYVKVGRRIKIEHFGGMILGAREIKDDVIIRQNTTLGIADISNMQARPVIGERAEIGAGVVILGDITVGHDAIVGANALVAKDVPPFAVVGGVPARLIRMRDPAK